jgi:hypothetical protein
MVTSDNGRSVHDDTQEYEDAQTVDDVGLDSGGFDSNPKQVSGTEEVSVDRSGYGLRDRDYSHGNFGFFGPEEEVFEAFSAVMDAPTEELEEDPEVATDGGVPSGSPFYRDEDEESMYSDGDGRPMTDGGIPRMAGPSVQGVEGSSQDREAYTDGGNLTMADVDHEGPYGDKEGGAPW